MFENSELAQMVRPDHVDRRIYTDPELFNLEMERIFHQAWIYVGHECQVKKSGDFFRARVGKKRIIVARHTDGELYAFHNRCTHRGSEICASEKGNTNRFICPYHAWSFGTNGELLGVPHKRGYEENFTERMAELNLEKVFRLDSYAGFIFASLKSEGESLESFLGKDVCMALDNFVDRSPVGELQLAEGKLIQTFKANWKLQVENSIDLLHPPILHYNAIAAARDLISSATSKEDIPLAIDIFQSNGLTHAKWDEVKQFALKNGHCYTQGFLQKLDDGTSVDEDAEFGSDDQMQFEGQAQYKSDLIKRHGKEKTEEILNFSRHNTIIYPNIFINPRLQQLRVLQPVAPDMTEQHCYVFELKGAPPAALHNSVAFLTASNSPASIVTTDDHEIFERIQKGVMNGDSPWLDLTRGSGDEESQADDVLSAVGTSELAMRNQHKAWVRYMTGEMQ